MLKVLIGQQFNSISRASDMLCLFLGEDYTFYSEQKNGEKRRRDVADFSLHFQTQWRFTTGRSIILGSRDIYQAYSDSVPEDWEYDIIGRADEESSVFDVNAKKVSFALKGATVVDAFVSDFGDVNIIFSNGVKFQSFTPASYKDEEWRLIDYKANNHAIVYDVDKK